MYNNCRCNCNSNRNSMVNCTNKNNFDGNDMYNGPCNYVPNYVENAYNSCACGFDDDVNLFPEYPMLAQSYVPWQKMNKVFTPEVGLKMGTIFPELVSPYSPGDNQELRMFIAKTNEIGKGCNG